MRPKRIFTPCRALTACLLAVANLACDGSVTDPNARVKQPLIEGSYEFRDHLMLDDGQDLYLVQVHFGTGDRADGHTYLAQVGVRNVRGGASVILQQETYSVAGDSITFKGGLLSPGQISPNALVTDVRVGGQRVRIELPRLPSHTVRP